VRFGVFDHMDRAGPDLGRQYAERLELLRAYDAGGLHGYHLAEHHGTPLGLAPSPAVFLAAAAQHTARLRLGALVFTLPQYHPLRLAEELCMLDHLSGGRLELGIGRGISPIELGFFGLSPQEAAARFAECRDILLAALTSERLTFHGAHYRFEDVPMVLRPVQRPHPPLWYGVSKAETLQWAAQHSVNCVMNLPAGEARRYVDAYRARWAALGRDGDALPLLGVSRHVVVADSDREALAIADRAYPQWRASLLSLWERHGMTAPFIGYPPSAREAIEQDYLYAGSAATVRAQVERLGARTGIGYLLCRFAFGETPLAQTLHSVALFTTEVIPALA
jgi:alkanesulfonate monooxygenase SsuD/methylene tetrahydromethanopterin reductase-like flavin-dependent oxidoreductase (luciferase family)